MLLPSVLGCVRFGVFADWVVWGGVGGFRCTGREAGLRAEVAKSAADLGRGELLGRGRSLPGTAQVAGEGAGQPELGVAGDDQPGSAVGGFRVADLRCGPAEGLLEQPEGVLKIEAAQEGLPAAVDPGGDGADA